MRPTDCDRRRAVAVLGALALVATLGGCTAAGNASASAATAPTPPPAAAPTADDSTSASDDTPVWNANGDTGADPYGGLYPGSLLGQEMHAAYVAFYAMPKKQQKSLCNAVNNEGTPQYQAWLTAHHVNRQGMDTAMWSLFLGKRCLPFLLAGDN